MNRNVERTLYNYNTAMFPKSKYILPVLLLVSFCMFFSRTNKTEGGPRFFFLIFLLNSLDVFIMSHMEAACLRCFLIRLPLYTRKVKSLYNPEKELLPVFIQAHL